MTQMKDAGRGIVVLRGFRCKNCFSFAEETIFSTVASDSKAHNNFLFQENGQRLLQVTSIYGANASGKTNLIKAIQSMLFNIVFSPVEIQGEPFFLNVTSHSEPILFEFEIHLDNIVYKYGYEATDDRIITEWLLTRKVEQRDFNIVFSRKHEQLTGDIDGAVGALKATLKQSKGTLFLHLAGKTSVPPFCNIFRWCKSAVRSTGAVNDLNTIPVEHLKNLEIDGYKREFLAFLKKFDPTIQDIRVQKVSNAVKSVAHQVMLKRQTTDREHLIEFPLFMESAGTNKLFAIYFPLMSALKEGSIFLVDELDFKLHPWIVRVIISMFHDNETWNKFGAQLIFSAHSTACMNGQDLRMDEVCFVEKDYRGCSTISRLAIADNKISPDTDFGKYYLSGQLGAVPNTFRMDGFNDNTL